MQNNTLVRAPGAPCAFHVQDQGKPQDFNLTQSWGTTLRMLTAVYRQHFQNPKQLITHHSSLSHFTWTLHPIKTWCWKKFQQHWDKKSEYRECCIASSHKHWQRLWSICCCFYFCFLQGREVHELWSPKAACDLPGDISVLSSRVLNALLKAGWGSVIRAVWNDPKYK